MSMPEINRDHFFNGIKELLTIDKEWIGQGDTTMYIRPVVFATEPTIVASPSKEYNFFILCSPASAYYFDSLSVLIEDNDEASVISLPANFNVAESVGAVAVDVTLDKASGRTISVNYATSSDNSSSSAFEASSGVLTFEPGETTKSVNITVNDNDVFSENTNSFTLTLSNASNGTISDEFSSTLVTIDDNETLPTVSVADITVREGQNPVETPLIIKLSGPQDTDRLIFVGVEATGDLLKRLETITIPAQTTSVDADFIVAVIDDDVYEDTETFSIVVRDDIYSSAITCLLS